MKIVRQSSPSDPAPLTDLELAVLRVRLADAEETLRAIRTGEVDTVMVAGKEGSQVFTLEGAGDAYRVLIESMNEGALMLAADGVILYANHCFARMVNRPLEQVTGSSFYRLLAPADQTALRPRLKRITRSGAKIQVMLKIAGDSKLPVQISLRPLAKYGSNRATIGMVVTDMTEARRNEEQLRALTHRVVQVQETERGRVALELHDNITQLLCAVLFRSQALADSLSTRDGPAKKEALKLRVLLGEAAEEVERIAQNLRPSILEHLGLGAALRETCNEFADRTGQIVTLACPSLSDRLPPDTELALYRILQVALKNVEQHAKAKRVTVSLTQAKGFVEFVIKDDGIGFEHNAEPSKRKDKGELGLFSMSERAGHVGGAFTLKSKLRRGTEIKVRIPVGLAAAAA